MNTAVQLLFKTNGFLALANNIIECENKNICYVCLVKQEHLNRASNGHKVMITWDSVFVQGVDPKYQAHSTYDAMLFIENLIKRLARDCDTNHGQLYPLLMDVFQLKENYSLQVETILDPELHIADGFAEQIQMRLDEMYSNINTPQPTRRDWVSNIILVELPNKSTLFPVEVLNYGGHTNRIVGVGIFNDVSGGHWIAWIKNKSSWTELNCQAPSPSSTTKLHDDHYVKIAVYEREAVYPVQKATSRVANTANVAMSNCYEGPYMKKVYDDGIANLCENTIRHGEVIHLG